jgi:hypothetical protein
MLGRSCERFPVLICAGYASTISSTDIQGLTCKPKKNASYLLYDHNEQTNFLKSSPFLKKTSDILWTLCYTTVNTCSIRITLLTWNVDGRLWILPNHFPFTPFISFLLVIWLRTFALPKPEFVQRTNDFQDMISLKEILLMQHSFHITILP